MGALIDSSVLIAAERGTLDLDRALDDLEAVELAVSSVTASELLHGVYRATDERRRYRREAWVESILTSIPVVSFDLVAARIHGRLSAQLAVQGENVGAHDLIIAATALASGLEVLTRDERSFPRIPELEVVLV